MTIRLFLRRSTESVVPRTSGGEKDWEQDKLQWAQQMSVLLNKINPATNEAEGSLALCVSKFYRKRYRTLLFETKRQEMKKVRYHIVDTLSAKNTPQAPCGALQKHDHARNGRPTKELFLMIGLMIFRRYNHFGPCMRFCQQERCIGN